MAVILQIIGAVLVLTGFAASQLGGLGAKSIPYLALNVVGAALLAALALHDGDWGFLLLEGVWVTVSLASIGRELRVRSADGRT